MRKLPNLKTARLTVRLGESRDISSILAFFRENRENFERRDPDKPEAFYTEIFWRARLELSREEFLTDRSARFFVFLGDETVGSANFTNIIRGGFHACYLGYSLAKKHEGQGLMTEAVRAAIDYAFGELNLHRVMANYMPDNERSARVLRRLGFVVEGTAKNYLWIDGAWRDHVLTSLVNPAWKTVPLY